MTLNYVSLQPLISRVRTDLSAVKKDGKSFRTNDPINEETIHAHLNGGSARGVYPIRNGESTTKVALLDLDSHKGETPWEEMAEVAQVAIDELKKHGMRPIPFRSTGGKGIHLYMIWDQPQDAYSVREFLKSNLETLGYRNGTGGVVKKEIEIFPKQDAVAEGRFGNMFILPYSGKSLPLCEAFDLDPMDRAASISWPVSAAIPTKARTTNTTKDSYSSGDRKSIGDLSLIANYEALLDALSYIPNDFDYDEYIKILAASKGAFAGNEKYYPAIEAWAMQWPDNTPESIREKWDSITDVSAGAGTIFYYAQQYGWSQQSEPIPDWVQEMNDKYFVVKDAGKTVIYGEQYDPNTGRINLVSSSFEDIRNLHKNEKIFIGDKSFQKGSAWTEHPQRRTYAGGIVFAPNRQVGPDQYNLWRGYGVKAKPGDWSLMRDHIFRVICAGNKEKYNYILHWLAYAIQHPEKPGYVAIVLQGGQGTGKGYFARYAGRLFGQHYAHIDNAEHVTGKFNGHLRDAVLVFADEALFAGDNKTKNRMKSLITESVFMLEDKYMKAQQVQNHMHFILASNERHVVNVEVDDRRHFILQVSEAEKNNRRYFSALEKEMNSSGPEAMLYDLQNMDLSCFDVFDVPKTEALLAQKLRSLTGPLAWLHDCLSLGEISGRDWTDAGIEISRQLAHQNYTDNHRQYRDLRTSMSQSEFGAELKSVFGDSLVTRRRKSQTDLTRERNYIGAEVAKTG